MPAITIHRVEFRAHLNDRGSDVALCRALTTFVLAMRTRKCREICCVSVPPPPPPEATIAAESSGRLHVRAFEIDVDVVDAH